MSFNKFLIQDCYQNKPKFNGIYSRKSLYKIKNGTYVLSLDEFKSIGTHLIALYANGDNVIYFDSFEVEHIPKEIEKFIGNKNVIKNIYRIQVYDFDNVCMLLYWIFRFYAKR